MAAVLRPRRLLIAGLTALSLLAPAAAAQASGSAVIRDCTDDGRLSKSYSQKDYRDALKDIPTDVDEYTDCRDVIRRAQLGVAGGGGGGGGSTGSGGGGAVGGGTGGGGTGGGAGSDPLATATPQERQAVEHARTTGGKPVQVAGQLVKPTALGYGNLGNLNTLPTPVIVASLLLAFAVLGATGYFVRSRVLARRTQA